MAGAIGTVYINTPMFAGPGYRIVNESLAEERAIVSAILDEAMAQAMRRGHAVAAWIRGEMADESLIGIVRAVTDGVDCMRHVMPEHRYDHTGPGVVEAQIGCVIESPEHADRLLAACEWGCFTTLPRFITLPAEHAIDTLVQADFDGALAGHGGIELDLCRDHDVVTLRAETSACDAIADALVDRLDPAGRGVAWVIDADAWPERTPDARYGV